MIVLFSADYVVLNAAVGDLRQWDARAALKARAGGRRNVRIAQVAANLERVANADEESELPAVLAHYPYAEDLGFLEYAVIAAGVAAREGAREARRAARRARERVELVVAPGEHDPHRRGAPETHQGAHQRP